MTTAEIESMADPSGVATADLNLKLELRHKVIPEFFEDVGYVVWRRRPVTKTLLANTQYVDLTDSTYTFSHIKELYLSTDFNNPLEYIGEDPVEVLKARTNTTPGKPSKFYLESSGTRLERVSFDCPADQQYTAEKRDIDHLYCLVCFFTHGLKTEIDERIITLTYQLGHTNKQQGHIETYRQCIVQSDAIRPFFDPGFYLMIYRHTKGDGEDQPEQM